MKKAIEEYVQHGKTSVMLLPVSTSTRLFHEYILPHKHEIRFLRRRVRFVGYNTFGTRVTNKTGLHDTMVVVFKNTAANLEQGANLEQSACAVFAEDCTGAN